jgi:peptidoglycan/xylan/chitin deacetylase (PgdA/CDA1 family)/GT2 family glycosyltransferase
MSQRSSFRPAAIREVELSLPVPAITAGPEYAMAKVLARWDSEPLALADIPLTEGTAPAGLVEATLLEQVGPAVAERRRAGSYSRARAEALRDAPDATVIICTRDRADRLPACLDAVLALEYPRYEVIVVDNAPRTDAVARLVRQRAGQAPVPVARVVESTPGLSWARNAGLTAAAGTIVAFLDDDERPDQHWLAELVRGFGAADGVAGASGLVLPAALDTPAQAWFEEFGGHSKGRGFTPAVFDSASHARQHPLYPLPPFGVGASMAFDRQALRGIGGFDVALGAGTPTRAGEDTAAIADLMLSGAAFVYWPGSVMWHEHRRDFRELSRQLNGYGSGLTAFYTRTVAREPRRLATLASLAPKALRGSGTVRTASMGTDYPARLRWASRRGMVAGPARYVRSRRVQAAAAATSGRERGTATIPVLMYHALTPAHADGFTPWTLEPELFEEHLAYLSAAGYKSVTATELGRLLSSRPAAEQGKYIALTFDDAYADFGEIALPLLAKYGMTGTLFVPTAHVAGRSAWMEDEGEGDRPLLSWAGLADVAASGVEIGAHSDTHPALDQLPTRALRGEVSRPLALLEDKLGVHAGAFAYPFGRYDRQVRDAVSAAGYQIAVTMSSWAATPASHPLEIPRLAVLAGMDDGMLDRKLAASRRGTRRAALRAERALRQAVARPRVPEQAGDAPPSGDVP